MSYLNNPWILCGIGASFCFGGLYLFFKKVHEEGESLYWPFVIMIMGVVIIAIGTAKYFKVID